VGGNPGLIVSAPTSSGAVISLVRTSGQTLDYRGVGSFRPGVFAGVIGSSRTFSGVRSGPPGTTLLLRLRPGVDPAAVSLEIRRALFEEGVDATPTRQLLDAGLRYLISFAGELQVLISLSLVVGVLSVGIAGLRAVAERRRALGLLRALGYQPGDLLLGLVSEAVLAASIGIVAGLTVGLVFGGVVVHLLIPHAALSVDVGWILLVIGVVYATVLIATIAPALTASRLVPVTALRWVD
jgi:putative ABC transport system permease protein